jgi:hypothetical protein
MLLLNCVVDVDSDLVLSPPEDNDHEDAPLLGEERNEVCSVPIVNVI